MKAKSILRLSALSAACLALAVGAVNNTAFADEYYEEYYDPYQEQYTYDYEDQTAEVIPEQVAPDTYYIPPESSTVQDVYGEDSDNQDYTASEGEAESSLLDADVSVDTKELTSEDWENIYDNLTSGQNSQDTESSQSDSSSAPKTSSKSGDSSGAFGTMKEKSESNDTWVYLAFGISLILAGVAIIIIVIAVNSRASKKAAAAAQAQERAMSEPEPERLEDALRADERVIRTPKRTAFGAKHAAGGKTQGRDTVQRDLVDTLDDPTDIDDGE